MEYGCQQVLVEDKELVPILEYLCQQSNKVYNSLCIMRGRSISRRSDWSATVSFAPR